MVTGLCAKIELLIPTSDYYIIRIKGLSTKGVQVGFLVFFFFGRIKPIFGTHTGMINIVLSFLSLVSASFFRQNICKKV